MNNLRPGLRVRVYRNLHRPGFFSIVASAGPERGKVIGYARSVKLADVRFVVSPSGRQKTLRSGKRRVHAWAVGTLISATDAPVRVPPGFRTATYLPFVRGEFFDLASGATLHAASLAVLTRNTVFYRPPSRAGGTAIVRSDQIDAKTTG